MLGAICGLYMDQHLKRSSAKNKPDQVTKLQQFLLKFRESNLIEGPDLTLPIPEPVPWNLNPNAQ